MDRAAERGSFEPIYSSLADPVLVLKYDVSATTFSPEGKIFQLDYAAKAVENSGYVEKNRLKDDLAFAWWLSVFD